MVTFRFYLVSIVAFFLALAVGVVVGSVLDGRIADGLQDRLDRVETSLDETVAAMDAKNVEIERLESALSASAPFAVEARLDGASALVVAETGVDDEAVVDLVVRLRQGGASVPGIVWLEPRWDLTDDEDLAAAGALAGAEGESPAAVHAALWRLVLAEGGADEPASDETTTTTTTVLAAPGPPGTPEDPASTTTTLAPAPAIEWRFDEGALAELADAGLVRLQEVDGDQGVPGERAVVAAVTGTASTLREPGLAAAELARLASGADVASVLAEVTETPEGVATERRGTLSTQAFQSGSVRFATVDHLELLAGRVATVLALAELADGAPGRYGYGDDVDGVMPRWQEP
jgi:hypothetical protein